MHHGVAVDKNEFFVCWIHRFVLDFAAIIGYNDGITKFMGHLQVQNLIKEKKEAKKALGQQLGFSGSKPLVVMVVEGEIAKDLQPEVEAMLEAVGHIEASVLILNDTDENGAHSKFKNVIYLPYDRDNRFKAIQAADMAITFQFNDVEEMMLSGTVPVSCKRKEVSDYDPNNETGNAFVYGSANRWVIFATLVRALETFKFPYDWAHIVRLGAGGMEA